MRKHKPSLIFPDEVTLTEEMMEKHGGAKHYRLDVKGKQIIIYTSAGDIDAILEIFGTFALKAHEERLMRNTRWNEVMRFKLIDPNKRIFQTMRYCYLGSIDDWIAIGAPGSLNTVLRSFVPHIEQDSYFELF